jgi:metal-sulfur cluster biosynthetic enzyme
MAPMPPTTDELTEALKVVIDPEIGINIVDLGLVYDVEATEDGEVTITYSLTSMGCPLGPIIDQDIRDALTGMEGIASVTNNLVMTPPWGPDRMSEFAKSALGFF